ncbi:MAG: tetratricopeptide repeat protein [bacterium]
MKIILSVIFLLFVLNINYSLAEPSSDKQVLAGLDDIYNLKFDDALKKFKDLQSSDPKDLKGFFYESLIYFYTALPGRDNKSFENYLQYSGKVIEHAENILDKNENDYDALYYKGLSHSYRSLLMLSLNKSLLQAASDGNDGYRILTSLIERKPDYYDAYMGLGLYKIAIGFVPEKFQWLLSLIGFNGNIKEGISLLKTSLQNGKFTKIDSKIFLSLFSLKEREDNDMQSLDFSKDLVREYPESPVFKIFYSGILLEHGSTEEAIEMAENALKLNSYSFQTDIRKSADALLGSAYFRLNNFQKAAEYLAEYMRYVNKEDRYNVYLFTLAVSMELSGDRSMAVEKYKNVRNNFNDERDGEADKFFYRLAQDKIRAPLSEFDILMIKGINLRESNKLIEAIAIYEDMISSKKIEQFKSDDDLILFYYNYGLASIYNKNSDKATECFNKCIKLNPQHETWLLPHSYFELGKIFSNRGDKNTSEKMVEKIFEYDNFDFESLLEMRLANFINKQ